MPDKPTYEDLVKRIEELNKTDAKREKILEELREREDRLNALYEHSPISIWEEDYSEVKKHFDKLRDKGVSDFREFFENNPDEAAYCGSLVKVADINNATVDMFRVKTKEDILENILPYFTESSYSVFNAELAAFAHGEDSFQSEVEAVTAHGDNLLLVISAKVIPAYEDTLEKVLVSFIDITERINSEEALRESEEKYRRLVENLEEEYFFYSHNTHGVFDYVSPSITNILGYTQDEFLTHYTEYLTDNPLNKEVEHYSDLSIQGEKQPRYEVEIYNKDGGIHRLEVSEVPIFNVEGNVIGVEGIAHDVTDRVVAEESRRVLEAKLQQTQRMEAIGSLAGGIAHDFNNLLFPIVGMSEMLLEDLPPGSPEHESVKQIFKAGMRGSDLVKQILAFSRQTEHKMIPLRFQQVLKEVVKLTRSAIPSDIKVSQHIQSDCGLIIADPTQLHQIAMNLITNAFHAVEQNGGKISVSLKEIILGSDELPGSSLKPGKYVMMSVADTGCGIDPAVMNKIFEPYFTTKEQGKGTGLGLAVAYGIVKEHGGDIRVYSEAGKGTTFNVYLPLTVQNVDSASSKTVEIQPTGTERILLVDDEEPIVNIERQILERLGYRVTTRLNSLDALEAFKANPDEYDLFITDMTMPNMTGDQLAKELIAVRSDIPIILCTGFSERLNQEKFAIIGVKGFLMKPVVKSDMAKMVRKVLDEAKS